MRSREPKHMFSFSLVCLTASEHHRKTRKTHNQLPVTGHHSWRQTCLSFCPSWMFEFEKEGNIGWVSAVCIWYFSFISRNRYWMPGLDFLVWSLFNPQQSNKVITIAYQEGEARERLSNLKRAPVSKWQSLHLSLGSTWVQSRALSPSPGSLPLAMT